MSKFKDIRSLIAKNNISRALKETAALIDSHDVLEDFENSITLLQAKYSAYEEEFHDESADPNSLKIQLSKIIKSLNFFLDKMQEELPDEPESPDPINPDPLQINKQIEMLTEKISHNIKKLERLNHDLLIESNSSTKFDLETMIENLENQLEADRTKLKNLQS